MSLPYVVTAVALVIGLLARRSLAMAVPLIVVSMLASACAPSDGSSGALPPLTNPPDPATLPESSGAFDVNTTPAVPFGGSVPAKAPTTTSEQVGTRPASITFTQLPDRTLVTPRFTLKASASSMLPVAFTSSTPPRSRVTPRTTLRRA